MVLTVPKSITVLSPPLTLKAPYVCVAPLVAGTPFVPLLVKKVLPPAKLEVAVFTITLVPSSNILLLPSAVADPLYFGI